MENEISFNDLPQAVAKLNDRFDRLESIIKGSQPQPSDFIGIDEAAQYLGIAKATLYSKVSRKEVPFHKPKGGKKLLFKIPELESYIENGREPVNPKSLLK